MRNSFKGFKSDDLPDGSVILPPKLQPSPLKMENAPGFKTAIRPADYIGSFLVDAPTQKERTEIVYKKLESMRNVSQRKSVLLVISLSGIKVCNETGESVRMAHALRRISYATSDPDFCQFSFLAREPKGQANAQYCHTFITKTPALAEELNEIVGEAFRLAYSRQKQLSRGLTSKTPSFNDIIERQLRRQRPHGMETAIEEVSDESLRNESSKLPSDNEQYNLLSGSKAKKPVQPAIVKERGNKTNNNNNNNNNNNSSPVVALKEKIERQSGNKSLDIIETVPNESGIQKITVQKPLPIPPTSLPPTNSKCHKNQYDETDDLVAEVSLEHDYSLNQTPPWMYANRRVQSAFVPQPQTKSGVGPRHLTTQDKSIMSPDRPCSGPHSNPKPGISDMYKSKEMAPLPPQRMDSLPSYDLAERGCAEGESGVGTGATSLPGKYHQMTDVSTMGSTSDSSEKSTTHDVLMDAIKWPEKWHQPDIPREVALDLLSQGQVGSFVVRDSSSHLGCYALSVKVSKVDNPTGVIHYLIQRVSTGFKLKGLDKEWPTMKSLVTHLTVMPEMLPCPLVLVTPKRHPTTSNPAFCPIDAPRKPLNLQEPMCDSQQEDDEDLDYQRLSDFSSIMADLSLS